jgi:singapore isolate B (sub-type 7) whole genome shotgun sequence assembly, scaffold_15
LVGKYGIVHRGILLNTGESVAVKIIHKSDLTEKDLNSLKRECRIMYELRNHPHIISLKDFCQDSANFYIVEELAEGGELFDAISRRTSYSEREAQNLVRTLLYTLRYCHEKGVVHRDLKPENILLKNSDDYLDIKIADFGFATHVRNMIRMECRRMGINH